MNMRQYGFKVKPSSQNCTIECSSTLNSLKQIVLMLYMDNFDPNSRPFHTCTPHFFDEK